MNRAIEMMGLAKEYSGKRVIDDLSRDVEKGEIFLSQLPWALKMVLYLLPLTHCSMCLRAAALGQHSLVVSSGDGGLSSGLFPGKHGRSQKAKRVELQIKRDLTLP
ncbi:MAG: hypothetical protein LUO92_04490 [Methanothrix sp.]|nr:hypothetical protein [Methanothrix sp.]